MAQETSSSTYNISGIKGDVWLHQEQTEKLTPGKEYSISLGDVLITAPLAEATVELSSTNQIHVGNNDKEVFVFDRTVEDQIHDITEVAIDGSSRVNLTMPTSADVLTHDINLNTLLNEANGGFITNDQDSALSYQSIDQYPSHPNLAVELRDVISDFNPSNDRFVIPHPGSIAKGSHTFTEAQNKVTISHYDIALHKIDDHGYVSFKDSQGRDIQLSDPGMLNPVVHYLAQNFSGNVGDTLMFKVAHDSYIYHFNPEVYAQHYNIIKFEGLAFDGMSHSNDSLYGNYLYIDFS
jgi:hypothetical protein